MVYIYQFSITLHCYFTIFNFILHLSLIFIFLLSNQIKFGLLVFIMTSWVLGDRHGQIVRLLNVYELTCLYKKAVKALFQGKVSLSL